MKIERMNIAEVESRVMLNYYCQADSIKTLNLFNNVKSDTVDISIPDILKEHLDIHKLTASKMFNIPYDEVTDEQRRMAKTLNFRKLYAKGGVL